MNTIEIKVVKKKLMALILAAQFDSDFKFSDGSKSIEIDYKAVVEYLIDWLNRLEKEE